MNLPFLPLQTKFIATIIFNLVLCSLLWLGYSTDYTWYGNLSDWLFPPIVGLIALVSYPSLTAIPNRLWRIVLRIFSISSIGGGCFPICVILVGLAIAPLGVMFMADEINNEVSIQQSISPDKDKIADVYFRGVGAYDGGNGRISVRVRDRWFPIVEREVYFLSNSYADKTTNNYLHWVDNDTLFMSEENIEVKVGKVQFRVPIPFILIYYVVLSLSS